MTAAHRCPPPTAGWDTDPRIAGLPGPVRRYFRAALAGGTPLGPGARLRMRGSIRLGTRWVPFRATEVIQPGQGFCWQGRAAGLIAGADGYASGRGFMDWRLLGLLPVARASGPDLTRSTAGRLAGEAVWAPAAMLPRDGVTWTARDDHTIEVTQDLDGARIPVRYDLNAAGLVHSVCLNRWGDPDQTGTWGLYPFGFDATRQATFGGVTIPCAGRAGWHYGTSRWPSGEFFRFEITGYEPVITDPASRR